MRGKTILACVALTLLAACTPKTPEQGETGAGTRTSPPAAGSPVGPPKAISTIEDLQSELAARIRTQMHIPAEAQDFQVIVNGGGEYPVGTILRQGSSWPINYLACAPKPQPDAYNFAQLTDYKLKHSLAAEAGLDNALVSQIADAGFKISTEQDVDVSVKSPKIKVLADSDIDAILASSACTTAMKGQTVWLVRGYIIGQRTFTTATSELIDGHAKAVHVASVDVKPQSSSTVGVTDSEPNAFLMIVSEVKPPVSAPALLPTAPSARPPERGGPEPNAAPAVQRPTASTKGGNVYIQRDEADTSGAADKIYKALVDLQARQHGAPVAKGVQRIKSAQMPTTAQIRYFNDQDKAAAQAALQVLAQTYPTARLVRMALPAPPGQYEVWLPKQP